METLGWFAGQAGAERAISPLIERLGDDRDIRNSAVQALGRFAGQAGIEKAIPLLLERFKHEAGQTSGFYIAVTLMRLDANLFEQVARFIQSPPDPENPVAIALLQDLFAALDKDAQAQMIFELAELPAALSWLRDLRSHERKEIREAAELTLTGNFAPDNLAYLQALVQNDKKFWLWRVVAVETLARMNTAGARKALLTFAKDFQDTPVGGFAYTELARLGETKLLPILDDHLQQLAQQRKHWRQHRAQWRDKFENEKEEQAWKAEMKKLAPRPLFTAFVAEKAARLDPGGRGLELLAHPLAGVREGAQRGYLL